MTDMRCKYCGSTSLHSDKQHQTFSTGKAVTGAVVLGPIGVAAGMIGKDKNGYRCGACGAFMEELMDLRTENAIDSAIADAEAGRDVCKFQYYKRQYANIQAAIPAQKTSDEVETMVRTTKDDVVEDRNTSLGTVKHEYRNLSWIKECPIFVEKIIIKTSDSGDSLSLVAWNQDKIALRSAYFQVTVYDDAGDEVRKCSCVYQGLSVRPGDTLPVEKEFSLQTDLAYRVGLVCEKAVLENDFVWRDNNTTEKIVLPLQPDLKSMDFPRLKYVRRDLGDTECRLSLNTMYLPIEHDDYWQCICGHPAKTGEACPYCGAKAEKLHELLSQSKLQEKQIANVRKRAAERANKSTAFYKMATENRVKNIYNRAVALQNKDTEESLKKAIELFLEQQAYKDSASRADECRQRFVALRAARREREAKAKAEAEAKAKAEVEAKAKAEANAKIQIKREKILLVALAVALVVIMVLWGHKVA